MLLLAYCVQNGKPFMGHEVTQGDVIYFALEDSKRRMKDREQKLGVNNRDAAADTVVERNTYLGFVF